MDKELFCLYGGRCEQRYHTTVRGNTKSKVWVNLMTLTAKIKLRPTPEQEELIRRTMREYISLANDVMDYALATGYMPKLSSGNVRAPLPSAVKNQCLLDAKSAWGRFQQTKRFPVFRKLVAIWNNQNYSIRQDGISFPVWSGKCTRIFVKAMIPESLFQCLQSHRLGTLRITWKGNKLMAQIAYEQAELNSGNPTDEMGVDLGILCPAVCCTSTGKVKFFGNGRRNKQVRRHYSTRRKNLGKKKRLKAIKRSRDKEQRWMRDQDHKISRQIVNFAIQNNVNVIKLEKLTNIRSTARTSRKNNKSLQTWSFYRLTKFIEYKAALAGIRVEYVDPRYTSQTCPHCGKRHKAKGRNYQCACGYRCHRDLVGARNILAA